MGWLRAKAMICKSAQEWLHGCKLKLSCMVIVPRNDIKDLLTEHARPAPVA